MNFFGPQQTDEQEREVQTRPATRTRPSGSTMLVAAAVLLLVVAVVVGHRRGESQQQAITTEPIIATIQVAPTVAPAPTVQQAQPTPGFVEMSGIGVVTMDIADLGTSAAFFTKLAPARMMLVVPNGDVSVSQLALGGTLFESSQVSNYLAVAYFEEARTVSATDQQGNNHTLTLTAGQYNLNWYDTVLFFFNYTGGVQYQVSELQLLPQGEYPGELGITPPGLANFVIMHGGTRYVLWGIWDPATTFPFDVGHVDGSVILNYLLNNTIGGSYTAPTAPSVAPEGADAPPSGGGCPTDSCTEPSITVVTPQP